MVFEADAATTGGNLPNSQQWLNVSLRNENIEFSTGQTLVLRDYGPGNTMAGTPPVALATAVVNASNTGINLGAGGTVTCLLYTSPSPRD